MATPLNEQIVTAMVTQLETIKKENGFSFDVRNVVRGPFSLEFEKRDAPILFVEIASEEFEGLPGGRTRSFMSVTIAGGLSAADAQLSSLNQLATDLNQLEYDVKRLFGESAVNNTLGGLLIQFRWQRSAKDLGWLLPNRAIFVLEAEAIYDFDDADPSQSGL